MSLRCAILGFLELQPATGYTLQQRFSGSVGSFWSATQSQIYRELHRLEREGAVRVEVVPQDGKPARKVYSLTATGQEELKQWLHAPVEPTQLRDPLLLKLVFAADVPPTHLSQVLGDYADALRETKREYQARLASPAIFTLARSEREALLWRLAIENGLAWCKTQIRWAEHAADQLGQCSGEATKTTKTAGRRKQRRPEKKRSKS